MASGQSDTETSCLKTPSAPKPDEAKQPAPDIKSTQHISAETQIDCASPPCLLHEIEAWSREFAY